MTHTTLVEVIQHHARTQPDKLAFRLLDGHGKPDGQLTFKQLYQEVVTTASYLQETHKVVAGEPILLLLPTSLEFIKTFFACIYLGAIAVPCYHNTRDFKRLPGIANDSGARVIVTNTAGINNIPDTLASCSWINADTIHSQSIGSQSVNLQKSDTSPHSIVNPSIDGNTIAYLQYSSGSTGKPKGIMVSHSNLIANIDSMCEAFSHTSEHTRVMTWLPLFHDMGLIGNVLVAVYLGVECTLLSPMNFLKRPLLWLKAIADYGITFSGAPNFAYELCLYRISEEEKQSLDLSSWEVAFNGAEPVRAEVIERFSEKFSASGFIRHASYPCYGLAEATLFVAGRGRSSPPLYFYADRDAIERGEVIETSPENGRSLVSCGHSWTSHNITIRNPDSLCICSENTIGEICVSGPSLAQGYWKKPELSQKTYIQEFATDKADKLFLKSGDLGFIRDGELYITGRSKDLIIIRGRNHHPEDIERTVVACREDFKPDGCAAFSVTVNNEEQLIVLQEVRREYIDTFDEEEITGDVTEAITSTHNIRLHQLVLIAPGSISKTTSGKIQRRICRTEYLEQNLRLAKDLQNKRHASRTQDNEKNLAVDKQPENSTHKKNFTISGGALKRAQQIHAFAISVLSLVGVVGAIAWGLLYGISTLDVILMLIMYSLTMIGMTVGFHRMLSHKSFEASPITRAFLTILGAMVAQGSPIYWVANHRRHHQFSDMPGDPHSPLYDGEKPISGFRAFWHAHIGWMFNHELSNPLHYCKDLIRDPIVSTISKHYYFFVIAGLLIPTLLGGVISGTIEGAISGLLWGGFARLFVSYHATSCINSVTHMFGKRPFNTRDKSRNTSWLAIITFGEAWHNNHHAFPASAYFFTKPSQIDLGGYVVWLLARLGLISHVRYPSKERINTKLSQQRIHSGAENV